MEEVRTSIEKIFDSFEAANKINTSAKRLSYSFINNNDNAQNKSGSSSWSTPAAKRSRGEDGDISLNSTHNSSSLSNVSQWEHRILKSDLIEANTKILQLKKEIEDRVHLHKNLEQLYEGRLKGVTKQLESSTSKNKEHEKMVKYLRKKSAADREELVKTKNEMAKQKQHYDEMVRTLEYTNQELDNNLGEIRHNMSCTINNLQLQCTEMESELRALQEDLDTQRARNEDLVEKMKEFDFLSNELDNERYQFSSAQRKIKELENDLASHGEWKNLSKVFQARLSKVTELERECERLTRDNKNLYETIGNKLLLEEQVHDLKTRLELKQQESDSNVQLEIKLRAIEQEVNDWKAIAKDFCAPNTPMTPVSLKSCIEDIQKKHLILTSTAGLATREKATVTEQIIELRKQNELYLKTNENLTTNLRNYKNGLHRMQKKLTLIAKERDCFKNLLENYEKDLTISAPAGELHFDAELKSRLDIVEKSLAGYKDICATLEKELEVARSQSGNADFNGTTPNDHYEHLKNELEKRRQENERLQRRKDELEMIVEQASMKEAYSIGNGKELKVVHMTMNPAEEAHENHKNEMDKLKAEIERLKRKIRRLENDKNDMTARLNETTSTSNTTINIQEIGALRNKIQSLENKQQHYKEIYRAASLEFREVIYLLFGYRVDRIGNNNYRISSVYAENEDEYLNFRLNDMGELDMLETEYSLTLVDMVTNYLAEHHSMPAFLSSLTLELFNRSTVAVG